MSLVSLFSLGVAALTVLTLGGRLFLHAQRLLMEFQEQRFTHRLRRRYQRLQRKKANVGENKRNLGRKQLPSISRTLVDLAIQRLPKGIAPAEKRRWTDEMLADVGSVEGRFRRLRMAFNIWRKGAPAIPAGKSGAPRRASD
jgi:hypothetical protein